MPIASMSNVYVWPLYKISVGLFTNSSDENLYATLSTLLNNDTSTVLSTPRSCPAILTVCGPYGNQ